MKTASCVVVLILLMGMLGTAFNIHPVKGGTSTVPDDYPTIQAAVNAAPENDTVFQKRNIL